MGIISSGKYSIGSSGPPLPDDLPTLVLIKGHLSIDGKPVSSTHDKRKLYWERKNTAGVLEQGVMRFSPDLLFADCTARIGDTITSFLAASDVKYQLNLVSSHPFIKRSIRITRNEGLDHIMFFSKHDLQKKLKSFKDY